MMRIVFFIGLKEGSLVFFEREDFSLGVFLVGFFFTKFEAGTGLPGDSMVVSSAMLGFCFTSFWMVSLGSVRGIKSFTTMFLRMGRSIYRYSCKVVLESNLKRREVGLIWDSWNSLMKIQFLVCSLEL